MSIFFAGNQISQRHGLFAPPAPSFAGVVLNYLLVGGGGGGQDTQRVQYGTGGNGGQVLLGSNNFRKGYTYYIYVGSAGASARYGDGNSATSNTEVADPTDGGNSQIYSSPYTNITAIGGNSGVTAQYQGTLLGNNIGGSGGNGITLPHDDRYGFNGNYTQLFGGDGIPIIDFVTNLPIYYAAGGGGTYGNGDDATTGGNGYDNYGSGGNAGSAGNTSNAEKGKQGVVKIMGSSSQFGQLGTFTPNTQRDVVGSNTILTFTTQGQFTI